MKSYLNKSGRKKDAQMRHALVRAAERFGLALRREDLAEIVGKIRKNDAMFVRRTSLRCTVWDIDFREVPCRVVYDRLRGSIVTFLFRDGEGKQTHGAA